MTHSDENININGYSLFSESIIKITLNEEESACILRDLCY